MQFAGGRSIAQLADEWQRDAAWVEAAVRRALRASIPERDGGLKATRREIRAERQDVRATGRDAQAGFEW